MTLRGGYWTGTSIRSCFGFWIGVAVRDGVSTWDLLLASDGKLVAVPIAVSSGDGDNVLPLINAFDFDEDDADNTLLITAAVSEKIREDIKFPVGLEVAVLVGVDEVASDVVAVPVDVAGVGLFEESDVPINVAVGVHVGVFVGEGIGVLVLRIGEVNSNTFPVSISSSLVRNITTGPRSPLSVVK